MNIYGSTSTELLPVNQSLDIVSGRHATITSVNQFGFANVGTTEQIISKMSVPSKVHPQFNIVTAKPIRIKSGGNSNDTSLGTGARSVTIVGLDQNYKEQTSTIATAGVSASSATTKTYIRVYNAYVTESGSGQTNSADIIIENTDGVEFLIIETGLSQSQFMGYTIQNGKTGFIKQYNLFKDSSNTVDIKLNVIPYNSNTVRVYGIYKLQVRNFTIDFNGLPIVINSKSDVWLSGTSTSGIREISAIGEMYIR